MCTVLAFLVEVVDIPDIPSNRMITTCLPSVHWQELYFSPFEKLAKKNLFPRFSSLSSLTSFGSPL